MQIHELFEATPSYSLDDVYWHGGADVPTSELYGNDLGVLYVTRNKKAAEYFASQKEDVEETSKLHKLLVKNRKFADEAEVLKLANEIGISKSTYPDGTSQLFDPEFGDEEEKEELIDRLKDKGYNGAEIIDNVGFGNFRAAALFV